MEDLILCPFCHEYVDKSIYKQHERSHTKKRDDGQQTDYATLPADERDDIAAADEPTDYRHKKCGEVTVMPEEIVATYLKNPWFYLSDKTFCCGCGKHVPFEECQWVDTRENLQKYMDRLRAEKPELKPKGCGSAAVLFISVGLISTLTAIYYLV